MQNRGSPVNRIPIMAKDVLDLFRLYQLVVEKGGLVEVINRKIWRDITKGLNLPASITSAAFTLRTQYMKVSSIINIVVLLGENSTNKNVTVKYLYPYECFKEKLSTYPDLQSAIEGNRRETRGKQLDYQVTTNLPQVYPGLMLPSFLTGLRLPNGLSDGIPHSRTSIPGIFKKTWILLIE